MANIAPLGKYRAFDDNGDPLAGGLLYTYEAGTSTPKATYTTADGDVSNANPVVLDADGYADVWLGDGGYKFILKDSSGNTIFTTDDIGGTSSTAFGAEVNSISSNTSITTVYANSINECTSNPTLSLLPVAEAGEGFYFSINNIGVGTVTIDPDGSELINGASTYAIPTGTSALVYCNGTAWRTLFYRVLGTASAKDTGTSGNTVPLLDGANTWSASQIFSANATLKVPSGTGTLTIGTAASSGTAAQINFIGNDSGAAQQAYSNISSTILDNTAASEDARLSFSTNTAGFNNAEMTIHAGVALIDATGGEQGLGTINTVNYYKNGTLGSLVKTYTSSDQTITAAGQLTLTHGLGGVPDFVNYFLVFTGAQANYSIGDVVPVDFHSTTTAANRYSNCTITSTEIIIRFTDTAASFVVGDKTTGGGSRRTWATELNPGSSVV